TGNIALHARVVQSSLGHQHGAAEHAVDGNREADYWKASCTHTTAEFNPWWRADLGNIYSVNKVAITNRGDCCKERLRGAQIRIGNKLENNGNNNELVATVLTAFDGTKTFEFEPVNGRYVNIFLPGNDEVLTLCEVEVFAGEGQTEKDNSVIEFVYVLTNVCMTVIILLTDADKPHYICVPSECSSLL
uniref:Si:ch73-359m17.2 n=1 Tax=Cyprinus carpio TaxID=7962 RepID=A0A8C1ST51_CYPCA